MFQILKMEIHKTQKDWMGGICKNNSLLLKQRAVKYSLTQQIVSVNIVS